MKLNKILASCLLCPTLVTPLVATSCKTKDSTVKVQSIAVKLQKGKIEIGAETTATATVTPDNATNKEVTWSTDKTNIISVDSTGKVKGLAVGKANVIATAKDGSGVVGQAEIEVTPIGITSIEITCEDEFEAGTEVTATATVTPSTAVQTVKWSLKDSPSFASIGEDTGKITSTGDGSITIIATSTDGSGTYGEKTVTITPASVHGITVNCRTYIDVDDTSIVATATIDPTIAKTKTVKWTSSTPATLEIDETTGAITPKAASRTGVIITAEATDGSGIKGTSVVWICNKMTKLEIDSSSENAVGIGESIKPVFKTTPTSATLLVTKYDVEVADPSIVDVKSNGEATGKKVGSTSVKFTCQDGYGANCTWNVTVGTVPVTGLTLSCETSSNIKIGESASFFAKVAPQGASNKNVTWSIDSGSGSASIDTESGLLTATAAGTVTVKATAKDGSGVSSTTTITIDNDTYTQSAADYIFDRTFSIEGIKSSGSAYARGTCWVLKDATPDVSDDFKYYIATNWHVQKGIEEVVTSSSDLVRFGTSRDSSGLSYSGGYITFTNYEPESEEKFYYDGSDITTSQYVKVGEESVKVTKTGKKGIDLFIAKADFSCVNKQFTSDTGNTVAHAAKAKLNKLNVLTAEGKNITEIADTVYDDSHYADKELTTAGFPVISGKSTWQENTLTSGNVEYKSYDLGETVSHTHWSDESDHPLTDVSAQYCLNGYTTTQFMPSGASGSMLVANFGTSAAPEYKVCGIYWGGYTYDLGTYNFKPHWSIFNHEKKNYLEYLGF